VLRSVWLSTDGEDDVCIPFCPMVGSVDIGFGTYGFGGHLQ